MLGLIWPMALASQPTPRPQLARVAHARLASGAHPTRGLRAHDLRDSATGGGLTVGRRWWRRSERHRWRDAEAPDK
jgi:hypothetical protein